MAQCHHSYQIPKGAQKRELFKCENAKFILFVWENFSFVCTFSMTWTRIEIKTYDLALRKYSYVFRAENEFWSTSFTFHAPLLYLPVMHMWYVRCVLFRPFENVFSSIIIIIVLCILFADRSASLIRSKVKDILIETYCHLLFIPVICIYAYAYAWKIWRYWAAYCTVLKPFSYRNLFISLCVFIIEKQIEKDEDRSIGGWRVSRMQSCCAFVKSLKT